MWSFLGRATFQLNPNTQLFAEASWAKQKSTFRISQTPVSQGTTTQQPDGTRLPLLYPAGGPYYPGNGIVPAIPGTPLTGDLDLYWRALETGPRTNQATTDEYRILVGASGLAWGWDYNVGAYYVSSEVTDTYLGGYLLESKLLPAMYSGVINPFGYPDGGGHGGATLNADHRRRAHCQDHRVGRRRGGREADCHAAGRSAEPCASASSTRTRSTPTTPSPIIGIGRHHRRRRRTAAFSCRRPSTCSRCSANCRSRSSRTSMRRWPSAGTTTATSAATSRRSSASAGSRRSALLIRGSYGQGFQAPTIPDTGVAAGPRQRGRSV